MEQILILLMIVVVVGWVIIKLGSARMSSNTKSESSSKVVYTKKPLLSENEKMFLAKMAPIPNHNFIIIPQVNLASIIQKTSNSRYHSELFRNIDFGVFDNSYNLLLLIELNDSTHQQSNRKYRDSRVRDIVSKAGIPFMTFYTNKPNEQTYVVNRILDQLAKDKFNV